MRLAAACLAFLAVGCAMEPLAAEDASSKRPMTLVDLVAMPSLSGPDLSPDGTQVLYTLTDPNWDRDRHIPHVWRADVATGAARRMTAGVEGQTDPEWAPDGSAIAFLAERDGDEHKQLYLLPSDGGEARRISDHETAIAAYEWAPDGATIYFLADDPATAEQEAREKRGDRLNRFEEKPFRHVWRLDVAPDAGAIGEAYRLTEGAFTVRSLHVSADGRRILHDRFASSLLDDLPTAELWTMAADGSDARQITRDNQVFETGARLSPDGASVLFVAGANAAGESYHNDNLFVVPADGSAAPRLLLEDMPYDVRAARWTADGRSIVFRANTGVRDALFRVDLASERLPPLTDRAETVSGWDYDAASDTHVVALDGPTNAGDLWRLAADGAMTPITDHYGYLARTFDLPRQEVITWTGEDGVEVEGILTYPLGGRDALPAPLIVNTHGGPASTDQVAGFSAWEYLPVAAAHGYAVLRPNYRGSTGYGDEFLRDMVGSYFNQAHKDVMAGVDALIARGIADPDRLVKMGWSAGGHMTNKIITYTDRFAAASSGAGAVNWISMYGQSDIRIYRTPWFGDTPWVEDAPIETYWEHSPLSDIHKVTTPTLILVGENDVRVPMAQSVELYYALSRNGVTTRLITAPGEPHGWRKLSNRLFKGNLELDWFATHALGQDYTFEPVPTAEAAQADDATDAD
ncbi:hypothetical protein CCR80_02810 [Rhodothalassium salexigens]|uniref:S9 family peptidase n=1 Tax=Rhodothalassium salexigens TaxID=1086 RepID=UPI00191253B9|nr:S9 family peptidase [Rhodothalassium salexigens]MBK5919969.1 hypothetical protein [Rhodothalassium salexigens]